jgi:hypothetical protein
MAKSETFWSIGLGEFNLVHRHARVPVEPGETPDPDAVCTLELERNTPFETICRWNLKTPQRTRTAILVATMTIRILTENMRGNGLPRGKPTVESPIITIDGHEYRVSMERLMRKLFVVQLDKGRRAFQWEFEDPSDAAATYAICRGIVEAYSKIRADVTPADPDSGPVTRRSDTADPSPTNGVRPTEN